MELNLVLAGALVVAGAYITWLHHSLHVHKAVIYALLEEMGVMDDLEDEL